MTRGSNNRPLRRAMSSDGFERDRWTVELREGTLAIRPFRSRAGGPAEITLTPSQVYVHYYLLRVRLEEEGKRRGKKRGRRRR
jgi:hypothetical protein